MPMVESLIAASQDATTAMSMDLDTMDDNEDDQSSRRPPPLPTTTFLPALIQRFDQDGLDEVHIATLLQLLQLT